MYQIKLIAEMEDRPSLIVRETHEASQVPAYTKEVEERAREWRRRLGDIALSIVTTWKGRVVEQYHV